MPQFSPYESLDVHLAADSVHKYNEGDLIIYDYRQYKVMTFVHQSDGTAKMTISPTGIQDPQVH